LTRRRLDEELVARGLVGGLPEAKELIDSRIVRIDGAPGLKPGTLVASTSTITIDEPRPFASRGGIKLQGALEDFGLDVSGMRCLDAGAGSGGFTDCLLQAGAASVLAVDVGYGQFDWRLRNDPRVKLLERTNLRSVPPEEGPFDLIAADLSFLSLKSVARTIFVLARPQAVCLLLVKPQFEAQPEEIGPKGIVADPAVWERTLRAVVAALEQAGLGTVAVCPSRLKGATGNQEFFVMALPGIPSRPDVVASAVVGALR
jgi:23S rRNA (cytidine1920-2'-O)/16S rRNA (cytidine1409-2'-O)-methyltransferase